jgi:FkbM family methyltransferase
LKHTLSAVRRKLAGGAHTGVLALKRLLYRNRGEPYRVNGRTLRYLPGSRPVRLAYVNSPNDSVRYDALQVQLLTDSVKEGDFAIDLGAHYGQYTLLLAALCGRSGKVVAFEPDPYAREMLDRNLSLNPEIKRPVVESVAVSNIDGESILYSRGGNSQSSLARSGVNFGGDDDSERIKVQVTTLDSYIDRAGFGEAKWVKIDTEGAEIRILQGARQLLASRASIICELHPYAWPEFGTTFEDLKALAAESGRFIRYLDESDEVGDTVRYGTVILAHR